jgi:hypothetical protein
VWPAALSDAGDLLSAAYGGHAKMADARPGVGAEMDDHVLDVHGVSFGQALPGGLLHQAIVSDLGSKICGSRCLRPCLHPDWGFIVTNTGSRGRLWP